MEIVKFKNGKYGIRRTIKRLFRKPRYEFLDAQIDGWWDLDKKQYCFFDSLEDAISRIDNGAVVPEIMRSKK